MEQGNHQPGTSFKGRAQACLVATTLLLIAVIGSSQAAEPKVTFNLPASNAPHALLEFSHQAKLQVLFLFHYQGSFEHLKTKPVVGVFSPAEALALMLEGTPVAVEFEDDGAAMVIVPEKWDSSPPVASGFGTRGAPSLWAMATSARSY